MFPKKAHFLTAAIHTPFQNPWLLLLELKAERLWDPNHSKYTRSDLIYIIYIHVYTVHTARKKKINAQMVVTFAMWCGYTDWFTLRWLRSVCTFMSLKALTTMWARRLTVTLCCWLFVKLYMHFFGTSYGSLNTCNYHHPACLLTQNTVARPSNLLLISVTHSKGCYIT